jgi:hypothetical protein
MYLVHLIISALINREEKGRTKCSNEGEIEKRCYPREGYGIIRENISHDAPFGMRGNGRP